MKIGKPVYKGLWASWTAETVGEMWTTKKLFYDSTWSV